MSRFTGPIRLEHAPDDNWRLWKLLEPLVWEADFLGSNQIIEVPTGYVTDGASVPRLLWWLFPLTGPYLRAAALHDFLYWSIAGGLPHVFAPKKADADKQFFLAILAVDTPYLSAWIMWTAVRVFGRPGKRVEIVTAADEARVARNVAVRVAGQAPDAES